LNRLSPIISVSGATFIVFPHVYKPLDFSFHCIDCCLPGEHVLDMGCGCGVLGILAAKKGCRVTAGDINPEAIRNTVIHSKRNHVGHVVACVSKLFDKVGGQFDVIVCNPPTCKVKMDDLRYKIYDVYNYLDGLFIEAAEYLRENGKVILSF
jgi:release factor glutamine methyltransferase